MQTSLGDTASEERDVKAVAHVGEDLAVRVERQYQPSRVQEEYISERLATYQPGDTSMTHYMGDGLFAQLDKFRERSARLLQIMHRNTVDMTGSKALAEYSIEDYIAKASLGSSR